MASPESRSFIEEATEYLQHVAGREDLQPLLTQDNAWKAFVDEAELSRAEEDQLREVLKMVLANMSMEDKQRLQRDLQARQKFLEAFPHMKSELEDHISKIRALADHIDAVHKDCTISNVVADSAGATSGLLTIVGLVLAPVTVGGSLLLSAAGMGLGTLATVATVVTKIVEDTHTLSDEAEASRLASSSMDIVNEVKEAVSHIAPDAKAAAKDVIKSVRYIGKCIRAIRMARANPHLLAEAKVLMTTGKVSAQTSEKLQKAFGGTVLVMTRRARVLGAAFAGLSIVSDVVSLVEDSLDLYHGKKAESAEGLRELANELDSKLTNLTQIHDTLQWD